MKMYNYLWAQIFHEILKYYFPIEDEVEFQWHWPFTTIDLWPHKNQKQKMSWKIQIKGMKNLQKISLCTKN